MNKSNKCNLNSSTQQMFLVVSQNLTENATFNDFYSLKMIQPLNSIPHNSTNLQNRCCLTNQGLH